MSEQKTCKCGMWRFDANHKPLAMWQGPVCNRYAKDGFFCEECGTRLNADGSTTPMVPEVTSDAVRGTILYGVLCKLVDAQRRDELAQFDDCSAEWHMVEGLKTGGVVSDEWEASDPDGCGEYCHHECLGYYADGTEVGTIHAALSGGLAAQGAGDVVPSDTERLDALEKHLLFRGTGCASGPDGEVEIDAVHGFGIDLDSIDDIDDPGWAFENCETARDYLDVIIAAQVAAPDAGEESGS